MYILYSRSSIVTGRNLRRQLSCHGGRYRHYRNQRESLRVVRWGNTSGEDAPLMLNSAEAVANAVNKLKSLQMMKEAGVNVPRFSLDPSDFDDGATILGRRNAHRGGTDIQILDGMHSVAVYSDFFTEFVPAEREFRLHIFRGELIGAQVKRYEGDSEQPVPIRNHANGYVFVPMLKSRPHQRRIDAASAAVSSLGLDFGAVDILACPNGEGTTLGADTCVLEVNTAPGLSDRYLDVYCEAINAWAQQG